MDNFYRSNLKFNLHEQINLLFYPVPAIGANPCGRMRTVSRPIFMSQYNFQHPLIDPRLGVVICLTDWAKKILFRSSLVAGGKSSSLGGLASPGPSSLLGHSVYQSNHHHHHQQQQQQQQRAPASGVHLLPYLDRSGMEYFSCQIKLTEATIKIWFA